MLSRKGRCLEGAPHPPWRTQPLASINPLPIHLLTPGGRGVKVPEPGITRSIHSSWHLYNSGSWEQKKFIEARSFKSKNSIYQATTSLPRKHSDRTEDRKMKIIQFLPSGGLQSKRQVTDLYRTTQHHLADASIWEPGEHQAHLNSFIPALFIKQRDGAQIHGECRLGSSIFQCYST